MELQEIKASVKKVIGEVISKDGNSERAEIGDDASLIDSGFIDSLGAMQIIAELSETFDIIIFPSELSLDNFDSIEKVASFIHLKLNGAAA